MRALLHLVAPFAPLVGVLLVCALVSAVVAVLGARAQRKAIAPRVEGALPPPVVLRAPVPRPITTRSRPRTRDSPSGAGGGADKPN